MIARPLPAAGVERPRLLALLDRGVQDRLTAVLGPSGSGKSVLLRQWADTVTDRVVTWVEVDDPVGSWAGTDAVSFAKALVAALAAGDPGLGKEALDQLEIGGQRMGQAFLAALLDEIAQVPRTVVVVEDLHELADEITEELGWLVARLPESVSVVVSSRSEPAMRLARLRAHGQLTEVRAADLAFTVEEAAELVSHLSGRDLSEDQLRLLLARTQGWAVGVQLVALALEGHDDVDGYLGSFSGAVREVADYLTEEVVAHQPPAIRDFVQQTAVLDVLDAEVCEALTGQGGAHQVLLELERRDLFILPVDPRVGRYRYHPLFADVLRYRLRAEDPDRYEALLARAAEVHLARGEVSLAVELLLRAERWQEVLDLIVVHGWVLFEQGAAATAIRWLEAVPLPERERHGQAQIALVIFNRLAGNAATVDNLLDEMHRVGEDATGRAPASLAVVVTAGIQWHTPPDRALERAQFALDQLDQVPVNEPPRLGQLPDELLRGLARLGGGRALMHLDRLDEARTWLEDAIETTVGYLPWRVHALGSRSRLAVEEGRLEQALWSGQQALNLAEEIGLGGHLATADAHLGLAQVAYERDDLDEAERLLAEAEVRVRRNRRTNVVAVVVADQARLALARGEAADAVDQLVQWRREGDPLPPVDVQARLAAVEVRALLALGDRAGAQRALARAPQRVATLAAAAQLAAGDRDLASLGLVLDRWPASTRARSRIQYLLWRAVVASLAGDLPLARSRLVAAAGLAEVDGHRRVFLDEGPQVLDLLRSEAATLATSAGSAGSALRAVGAALAAEADGEAPLGRGVLGTREAEVLGLLDSRLSNQEIAEAMGISYNTLKTHLKRIYRKLGVSTRREAVEKARSLGLGGA